jgi:hypothetical protein
VTPLSSRIPPSACTSARLLGEGFGDCGGDSLGCLSNWGEELGYLVRFEEEEARLARFEEPKAWQLGEDEKGLGKAR